MIIIKQKARLDPDHAYLSDTEGYLAWIGVPGHPMIIMRWGVI